MWNKYGIVIPGVVWGFLLLGIGYFLSANFPDEYWMPLVAVLIGAVLKFIEVNTGTDLPDLPKPQMETPEGVAADVSILTTQKPKKAIRFFVG